MADGSTPQISWAYSVMVLSLENLPEHAIFLMTFLVHSRASWEEERQYQQSVPHLALAQLAALQGTLGWFKCCGAGLPKRQNLRRPDPVPKPRGVCKKDSTGAHSASPTSSHCTTVAEDPIPPPR